MWVFFVTVLISLLFITALIYDVETDFSVSKNLIVWVHILFVYLIAFSLVSVAFWWDDKTKANGWVLIFATIFLKYLPNLSLIFCRDDGSKLKLKAFYTKKHTNLIYGFLLTIMSISLFELDYKLALTVGAFIFGIFVSCDFHLLTKASFGDFIKYVRCLWEKHHIALAYAFIFTQLYKLVPITENVICENWILILVVFMMIFVTFFLFVKFSRCFSDKTDE